MREEVTTRLLLLVPLQLMYYFVILVLTAGCFHADMHLVEEAQAQDQKRLLPELIPVTVRRKENQKA